MYICILYLHTCRLAGRSDSAQFSFSVKQANRVVHRLHLGKTTGIMLIKVNGVPPRVFPFPSPAKCQRQLLLLLLLLLYPIAILPPSSSWPLEKDVPNRTSLCGCVCVRVWSGRLTGAGQGEWTTYYRNPSKSKWGGERYIWDEKFRTQVRT